MSLPLRKISFGKTDAFNELKEFGEDWFVKAFYPYEKYDIDSFIRGSSYYICGAKGTGKTALLRYLQCKLSEDSENLIIPIRFKTDFDSEDKKTMLRAAANVREVTAEGIDDFKDSTDAVVVWQVYILNKFFSMYEDIEVGEYHFFEKNREYDELKSLLHIVYPDYKNNKSKIVPHLKHGKLNINANILKVVDAQLQVEIGLDKSSSVVSFNQVAKAIISKFEKLKYLRNQAYILFDELELSIRSEKENQRDIKLVRDLILAIDRINEVCKLKGFQIHVIASIRTEVIKSVFSAGYEINKCIEDYGVILSWYQRGVKYENNKLLRLIEKKIIASEEANGVTDHSNIWERYFPERVHGIETQRYILNQSWLHPRDIVRLMNQLVEQSNSTQVQFTQEMFDSAKKGYASKSWTEITEGLSLKYTPIEIGLIKKIFTNIEVPFTFGTVSKRIEQLCEIDSGIAKFKEKYSLRDILNDLFEFGVIGNSGKRMIFKFMEDDDIALTENMIIHTPLRDFFAVQSQKKLDDVYEN